MEPSAIRVIAFCSLMLGSFFLAKSISIKTPKYVLHELLAFKVNKSQFFRKHITQKLESIIGLVFLFMGFGLLTYLEVEALAAREAAGGEPATRGFTNWWAVIGVTAAVMLLIAYLLSRVTRFFSGKIYVEMMRFMVITHSYPLEKDEALVRELGRITRVPRDDEDTLESYADRVRQKMKLEPRGAVPGPPRLRTPE